MALTVHLLVWLGVAIELACCVGLVAVRSAIDRLHFAGAATVVGPGLVAVAVCVEEGLFTSSALNALAVALLLALHLLGQRHLSSRYRAFDFPAGGNDPTSHGRRAVAAEADSLSPNTMPVDVDSEHDVALRHELDPRRSSSSMP